jgi:hypothetical protein
MNTCPNCKRLHIRSIAYDTKIYHVCLDCGRAWETVNGPTPAELDNERLRADIAGAVIWFSDWNENRNGCIEDGIDKLKAALKGGE